MWKQLQLASRLESGLRDARAMAGSDFVDFNAGNTQLLLFWCLDNCGAIDTRMNGSDFGSDFDHSCLF